MKKFNLASCIGILLAAAGFAIDAIQSALAEKEQERYIDEKVEEKVKLYLEAGTTEEENEENEESEEEAE